MTRPRYRRALATAGVVTTLLAGASCADDDATTRGDTTTMTTTMTTATADTDPTVSTIEVAGTTFHVERRGSGAPLLLIHGGGEDASMLAGQAEDLAAAGYEVVTYDRRGTGSSGRHDWPGEGAGQHADDAAALLDDLAMTPATVVGVSSGGVIALELAARHPADVARVVAWEPPAAGILPDGVAATAAIMAPVDAYLTDHPDDFVGAQALLLSAILGVPVTADDPAFAAARVNAEPMIRDEPQITLATFTAADLADVDATIGIGSTPNELVAGAVERLSQVLGRPPVEVDAGHEVYLADPTVLTAIVAT